MNILVDAIGKEELGQFISTKNFMPQLKVNKFEAVINFDFNDMFPCMTKRKTAVNQVGRTVRQMTYFLFINQ